VPVTERKRTPDGEDLPNGIWAKYGAGGELIGFKVKWRERTGPSTSSQRAHTVRVAQPVRWRVALREALRYQRAALAIADRGEAVTRSGMSERVTLDELFTSWLRRYAGRELSARYVRESARLWGSHVSAMRLGEDGARCFGDLTIREVIDQPGWLVAYQEALEATGAGDASVRKILFLVRGVLERGQRWHPDVLIRNPAVSMFEMPTGKRRRLVRAPSLIAAHRVREAILNRRARDPLRPVIEAALVAAMAETIALRPSELLHSVRWEDLHDRSLWIQRAEPILDQVDDAEPGLKTGARSTLLLPTARDELLGLRAAIERRYGRQAGHGLIFQKIGSQGPLWTAAGEPVPWSLDDYKRFTERVYRPARRTAARAEDVPAWVARMRFYDLRHGAVSLALHGGMSQHELSRYSGHSEKTLNDIYAHVIKEYEGRERVDMSQEALRARAHVAERPHRAVASVGPQTGQQRRRRMRRGLESSPDA
jgi:hypothetical protein